ncbi:MAG: AmmeMemoRadiSam system protein B [Deltaproteobacteria bacterium]|nr:AmmeMemoRadiSam system protein B [Deltaproteobacteria bacterium]
MIRKPAVAYQFYPGEPDELERTVSSFEDREAAKEDVIAIIVPHAGYIYSGKVAGSVYSSARICDNVILLGPNHTGLGEAVSIMPSGRWEIPTGTIEVNNNLARLLLDESPLLSSDEKAHLREHSLEVQLPFIHHFNRNVRIVPITIMHLNTDDCEELGRTIGRVIKEYENEVLIAVSSDMNHYESDEVTRAKDKRALDRLLALDAEGLLKTTEGENITMCGVIPAAVAISAAKELGATSARLVDYATSGDTSGDYGHVVGYAGVLIQ